MAKVAKQYSYSPEAYSLVEEYQKEGKLAELKERLAWTKEIYGNLQNLRGIGGLAELREMVSDSDISANPKAAIIAVIDTLLVEGAAKAAG